MKMELTEPILGLRLWCPVHNCTLTHNGEEWSGDFIAHAPLGDLYDYSPNEQGLLELDLTQYCCAEMGRKLKEAHDKGEEAEEAFLAQISEELENSHLSPSLPTLCAQSWEVRGVISAPGLETLL